MAKQVTVTSGTCKSGLGCLSFTLKIADQGVPRAIVWLSGVIKFI